MTKSNAWLAGSGVFIFFLTLFALLHSDHYMSVDGSVRSLEVYYNPVIQFHGNNHLLYPVWVFGWSKLLQLAHISAKDPFQFVRITEAMNSVFAAAVVAMLWTFINSFAGRTIAFFCSLLLGFSNAFLLHGTNAAEPMPGLFWSVLGVVLLWHGLKKERCALWIAAGLAFSMALASYESMGTVAGIGTFLAVLWAASRGRSLRSAVSPLLWVCAGGALGICAIYGVAYTQQGVPATSMLRQFFEFAPKSEVYGGFSLSRVVNLPFGMIRNLYSGLPVHYAGTRSLLQDPQRTFWIPAAAFGIGLIATIGLLVGKAAWTAIESLPAVTRFAAFGALFLLFFPPLYWDPLYDKLWLLPLCAMSCLAAASLRPGLLASNQRRWLVSLLAAVIVLQCGIAIPQAVQRSRTTSPHLQEAKSVSEIVRPEDWVVADFDDISILYLTFWGHDSKFLLLPSSNASVAAAWLNSAQLDCQRTGGRIIFIGVLDEDRPTWDAFLGKRVGIPFSLLDLYRTRAGTLASFSYMKGVVTVRGYRP
jgi:hypothetical protein